MALQSAATSATQSYNTRTGCTYVNTLITGATALGINFVRIDNQYVDSTILGLLQANGYQVTTSYNDIGTYASYLVTW